MLMPRLFALLAIFLVVAGASARTHSRSAWPGCLHGRDVTYLSVAGSRALAHEEKAFEVRRAASLDLASGATATVVVYAATAPHGRSAVITSGTT
jgi:hypothetical protein